LGTNSSAANNALPFANRLFNALDPVLQEAGRRRETEWALELVNAGIMQLHPSNSPSPRNEFLWSDFVSRVSSLSVGQNAFAREVELGVDLGPFHVHGRVDFILILWKNDMPYLRLVECKASRRDRTYHRVQVALYRKIILKILETEPITVGNLSISGDHIECVVARIDEATNQSQQIINLDALNLEMEDADVDRLVSSDGQLAHIVSTPLEDLPYQINQKCDACVYNINCLPESARLRKLELLGIEPATVRTLHQSGIVTIDDLASIDLDGVQAEQIRRNPEFYDNLQALHVQARSRRHTLPGGDTDPDAHDVEQLPNMWESTLPSHEINGIRLVRVYLCVDYDYTENRIGALSAHVTTSDGILHTPFVSTGTGFEPDHVIKERRNEQRDANGNRTYDEQPVQGKDIVEFIPAIWTGRYDADTGAERQLIQGFFQKVVDAIAEVAETHSASIHFYVWSRSEIAALVEACSRVDSRLLGHLSQLLGCRESLEQMIYSCVKDEVDRRYALGWTGRGLAVISSLRWYGQTYHWRRRVAGSVVDLDRIFEQDIFDFKTTLRMDSHGRWADEDDTNAPYPLLSGN
jgi:hypothetical protein